MSQRWQVKGLPLEHFNEDGGSVGEPFGAIQIDGEGDEVDRTVILTKMPVFYEGDEEKSSAQ